MSDYTCSNPLPTEKLRDHGTAEPATAPLPPPRAWHTEGSLKGA